MKLVSFGPVGRERAGALVGGHVVDLARALPDFPSNVREILAQGLLPAVREALDKPTRLPEEAFRPLQSVRLGPPVTDPQKIICLGLNYKDHAAEQNEPPPKSPILFAKATTSLQGPYDDIVHPRPTEKLDYEVELAFVIGKTARRVPAAEAMDFVAGYTILHDLSARDCQFADKQWYRGKSMDGTGPMGPWLVTPDEVPDPHKLRLTCRVNGEARQDSNTNQLIFDIPALVAFITEGITLLPGDVISTGTPPGVGVFMKPPAFLRPGDVVELSVEGLGMQKAKVVAAGD